MRKSFSCVLMGALGFSAAVGASSMGTRTIDFSDSKTASGRTLEAFDLRSTNAEIITRPGGGNAVLLDPFTTPFYNVDAPALSGIPDLFAFLAVTGEDPFEFKSVFLSAIEATSLPLSSLGDPFSLPVRVTGVLSAGGEIFGTIPALTMAGNIFSAESINEEFVGASLSGLGFSTSGQSGGGGDVPFAVNLSPDGEQSNFDAPSAGVIVDDIVLGDAGPAPVPVPASALLLGSALIFAGAWKGRRKKSD